MDPALSGRGQALSQRPVHPFFWMGIFESGQAFLKVGGQKYFETN
jgi:hypothetical protein